MTPDDVRAFALALPGTVELPHHERTSFRVGGKIFATMPPDGASVNVLLGEEDSRAAAEESPDWVELLWWGRRLSGVRVDLAQADADILTELLEGAYQQRAPRTS